MKTSILKGLAVTAAALAVLFGCDTVLNQVAQQGSPPGGDGFATVDSEFSDAPLSPGGTGGTSVPGTDPGNDTVELPSEETRSFFTAFQIDPVEEDSAGPKFVVEGDVDQDGLTDLVSAWNQSQPIQLHLQRRDPAGTISFRTITLAGTTPIAVVAGLELGQINGDGWLDVVVLVKATGFTGLCPTSPPAEISKLDGEIIVLFNPGDAAFVADGDRWIEMALVNPYVNDRWIHNQFPGKETVDFEELKTKPERAGFTALAVGDLDGNPGDEIVVALNPGECKELGQEPPTNTVDVWINPGGALAEDSSAWGVPCDIPLSRGVPLTIMADAPEVTDVALYDVDGDNDLDVVAAYSNSISLNVRWARNPLVSGGFTSVIEGASDPVPDVCSGGANDGGNCPNGDADCPGIPDGICVSAVCVGGATNGDSCTNDSDCPGLDAGVCVPGKWRFFASNWELRPIGQVDTAANVLAIGDVDSDTYQDVVVRSTVGQIVQWFRRPSTLTLPPEFPPSDPVPDRTDFPWPVFTLTEFNDQEPEAIALGDVTGDGQIDLMVAAEGGVYWYDGTVGGSVYDPWVGQAIIQDNPPDTTDPNAPPPPDPDAATTTPGGTGVGVTQVDTSTVINALLVVDLDGDGKDDIVGTLDRRSGAGLSDDRLVWYRNTRTDDTTPAP
ncbi:MAG: VCBS repeat-containing protein [Planctomycetota bacterium]